MSTNPFSDPLPAAVPYGRPAYAPARLRPGGVTAIAVLAIVFGALGLLGALTTGAWLIFSPLLRNVLTPPAGAGPLEQIQFDMQSEIMAINERYQAAHLVLVAASTVLGILLIVGGAKCLRMNPAGRKLLLSTLLALLIFELVQAALTMYIQMETMPIIEEAINRMLRELPSNPAQRVNTWMMRSSMMFGVVIAVIWVLAKVALYIVSAWYLSRPQVAAAFEK